MARKNKYYEIEFCTGTLPYKSSMFLRSKLYNLLVKEKAKKFYTSSDVLSTYKDDFMSLVFDEIFLKNGIVIYTRHNSKQKASPASKINEEGFLSWFG
ncbi:MAG: hypothetical protein ABIH63_04045 [archaeon]